MGKNDCPVCKKTANATAANKSGSVQCSTCALWYHPPCAGVSKEVLDLIDRCLEENLSSPWSCSVCKTAWDKFKCEMKGVVKLAKENEKRIAKLETENVSVLGKVTELENTVKSLKDQLNQVEKEKGETSGEKVLEEINARSSKDRNLVLHGCEEKKEEEGAQEADMEGAQDLMDYLEMRMNADRVLVGTRRLGRKNNDKPRPLLLIFKVKADRDFMLQRAPRLSRAEDESLKKIQIKADLTKTQRDMEEALFKRASENNLRRSNDEEAKNLVWKVLGRRGERFLRQLELRDDEEVNEDGRVVRRRDEREIDQNRGNKRPLSPGSNQGPPLRRQRARRFGQEG